MNRLVTIWIGLIGVITIWIPIWIGIPIGHEVAVAAEKIAVMVAAAGRITVMVAAALQRGRVAFTIVGMVLVQVAIGV